MNSNTLTAAWLRQQDTMQDGGVLSLDRRLAPILADALDIADLSARNCVESYATIADWDPPRRYDLNCVNPKGQGWLDQAVRYLDARGMLERKAGEEHLVRVLSEAKEGA